MIHRAFRFTLGLLANLIPVEREHSLHHLHQVNAHDATGRRVPEIMDVDEQLNVALHLLQQQSPPQLSETRSVRRAPHIPTCPRMAVPGAA